VLNFLIGRLNVTMLNVIMLNVMGLTHKNKLSYFKI
jgi:hypothetical protein